MIIKTRKTVSNTNNDTTVNTNNNKLSMLMKTIKKMNNRNN